MVEDDRGLGMLAGELDQLGELSVIHPGIERQPERCQTAQTFAERGPGEHVGWRIGGRSACSGYGVPGGDVAHAAEAAAAGGDLGFEHLAHGGAQPEIGIADDSCAHARGPNSPLALIAAMPLANSTSPTGCMAGVASFRYIALHSMNTVATMLWPDADVCKQLRKQVGNAVAVPQMMVRIDDGRSGSMISSCLSASHPGRTTSCRCARRSASRSSLLRFQVRRSIGVDEVDMRAPLRVRRRGEVGAIVLSVSFIEHTVGPYYQIDGIGMHTEGFKHEEVALGARCSTKPRKSVR